MAQIEIREYRERRRRKIPASFQFSIIVANGLKEAELHRYAPVSAVRNTVFNEAVNYAKNAAMVLGLSVYHLTWNMTGDGPKLTGLRRRIHRGTA